VDLSEVHLERARSYLSDEIRAGRVRLVHGDGARLPFPDGSFDCAVTIWLLEHVKDPLAVVRELKRVVRPGGRIILTEVENSTLVFEPAVPGIADWWDRFNRFQQASGGDPFIGKRLEGFCREAGFRRVEPETLPIIRSGQDRESRKQWLGYLADLLLSASENLERTGAVKPGDADRLRATFEGLVTNENVSFRYSAQRVTAWNDPV
jgi:SAM-dependent methyltransferase